MTTHPALATMLRDQAKVVDIRQAAARTETKVEYVSDLADPDRVVISIVGPSCAAVQQEITRCMQSAENMGNSFAQFLNPWLMRDGRWTSGGEVVVSAPAEGIGS